MFDMLDRSGWHNCTEDREVCSALHPNGNMRVTVYCECGRYVRDYIDSIM